MFILPFLNLILIIPVSSPTTKSAMTTLVLSSLVISIKTSFLVHFKFVDK